MTVVDVQTQCLDKCSHSDSGGCTDTVSRQVVDVLVTDSAERCNWQVVNQILKRWSRLWRLLPHNIKYGISDTVTSTYMHICERTHT